MRGRRNAIVAREGLPFVIIVLIGMFVVGWYIHPLYALPGLLLVAWLILVFRDPRRRIPASPLGVVSPVDGTVIEIGTSDSGVAAGQANRIMIRVDSFGTYTARSPSEGTIMDLSHSESSIGTALGRRGLWVRTDEKQDIFLQFHGYRFGLVPRAFLGFGERVGQGQRCAYLRLAKVAEIQMPIDSRALVTVGQRVMAGTDLLARLPHP